MTLKKYHYLYELTNIKTNRKYYGVHFTDDMNDGFMGYGKLITNAKKRYGIENFSMKIIKNFDTPREAYNDLHELEKKISKIRGKKMKDAREKNKVSKKTVLKEELIYILDKPDDCPF